MAGAGSGFGPRAVWGFHPQTPGTLRWGDFLSDEKGTKESPEGQGRRFPHRQSGFLSSSGLVPADEVLFPVSLGGASFFLNDQKETKESPGVGRGWLSAQRAGLGQSACTPGPPEGLRGRQPGCTDSFPARNLRRRGRFPRRPPALCGYAFGSFQHPRGRLAGRWNGLFGPIEGRLAEEPQEVPGFESGRRIFLLILFLARRPIGCLSLPSLCPQKGIARQGDLRTVVSRTPESCRCTFTDAPANFNGGSGGRSLLAKPRPGGRRPIRDAPPAILCLLSVRTESRSPSGRNPKTGKLSLKRGGNRHDL